MKNKLKSMIIMLIIAAFSFQSQVYADENTEKSKLIIAGSNKAVYYMEQNSDIINNLPYIMIVYQNGKIASGNYDYPNYDNTRLGEWDLEWIFTPDDVSYEPAKGIIHLNVVPPYDFDTSDDAITPTLTATNLALQTATLYDINLDNKVTGSTYNWTSSDTSIADVNPKSGLVSAKGIGKAVITCEVTLPDGNKHSLTSTVTVGDIDNAPLLTETDLDLEPGDLFDINLENKIAKSKYRWISSDRNVVKVNSSTGKVVAINPGEAFVTCTITTPDNEVIVLKCDISVTVPLAQE